MPSSWAASSKRVNRPFSRVDDVVRRHLRGHGGEAHQVGEGHRDLGEAVGDALLAAAQPVGDRRRQDVQQQLLVLAVLVLDDDVLLADVVDHAVEGGAELADLVARAHRHVGPVSPAAKRRTPAVSSRSGPSSERDSQAPVTITTSSAMAPTIMRSRCEPVDRREGLRGVDLGDQRPFHAGDRERPPRGERRDAAVAQDLAGALDAAQRRAARLVSMRCCSTGVP